MMMATAAYYYHHNDALFLLLFCFFASSVISATSAFLTTFQITRTTITSTAIDLQHGRHSNQYYHHRNHREESLLESLDIGFLQKHQDVLLEWLYSLSKLERSSPEWVGANMDLVTASPALLVQEHLEHLLGFQATPSLFPSEWSRAKFDFDWRYRLLKLIPNEEGKGSGKHQQERNYLLKHGRSNSHPLRWQLVAIPPYTDLPLHVHPAFELDIPLLGSLWERRSSILLPPDSLSRQPQHSIGTPLSNFSDRPTPDELRIIAEDLSQRTVLGDHGAAGRFTTHKVSEGECLVNPVGSMHQSFTDSQPCLLLVLGPNVHAHFLPGNFHQREGIDGLTGIEPLLSE